MQGRSLETFKTEDGGSQNARCLASGPESTSPAALRDGGRNHGSVPPPTAAGIEDDRWKKWCYDDPACISVTKVHPFFWGRNNHTALTQFQTVQAVFCPVLYDKCIASGEKRACWSFLSNKPRTLCKCQCSSTQTREDRWTLNTITTEKRAV